MTFREKFLSRRTAKAMASALVAVAAYLAGVFPVEAGLWDGLTQLTGLEWLGLVTFLGAAYGLTYEVSDSRSLPPRR